MDALLESEFLDIPSLALTSCGCRAPSPQRYSTWPSLHPALSLSVSGCTRTGAAKPDGFGGFTDIANTWLNPRTESGFKNRTNFVVTVNTEEDNAGRAPQNISTHTSADLNTRGYRAAVKMMEFKTEKRLCKMFYAVTLLFLLLWGPYVVASYLRVLVRPGAVPQAYLTASVWLTFAQAGINPVVCFLFNRELRDCFRAQFPCCQSPQATQATLPCDLKGIGL
ncbi:Putative G-protein coupled receptor 27 [Bos mutus]|uniref:Putative G-protein coupled receptor 27 n=1 Tax=Bos mutus TaxID=72004 RepID=L8HPX1_9CETA|nr:Putative G-protein coupled receptor 27 [Bos mutus]